MATATAATAATAEDRTWTTISSALKSRGYKNKDITQYVAGDDEDESRKNVDWWATATGTGTGLDSVLVVRCVGTRIMKGNTARKKVVEMSKLWGGDGRPTRLIIVADSLGFKERYHPAMSLDGKSDFKVAVRFLLAKDLRFNALEHRLVPKHKLMSERGVKALAGKYGFKDRVAEFKGSLPRMGVYDPVAGLLGGRPGDVFRIHRMGGDYAYRVVVADFGTA